MIEEEIEVVSDDAEVAEETTEQLEEEVLG